MALPSAYIVHQLSAEEPLLLRELLGVFADAFEDAETYKRLPPGDSYLENLLGGDHCIALVATQKSSVVGGLVAYELVKFEQERSEIYIYDLAVAEEHRRQGIATDLIVALKVIAKARGAFGLYVQADRCDAPAIALYTMLGVREDVVHFDIPVD